jgi:serine phosphatase RsbU (regulator of sigma subunit)
VRQLRETLAGRLFLLSATLLAIVLAAQQILPQPPIVEIFRKVLWLAFLGSAIWLIVRTTIENRRGLFWRVRRKLILSYVLLGVIPVALVVVFALFSAYVLYSHVAAYLFHDGLNDIQDNVQQIVETSTAEIGRAPDTIVAAIRRKQANLAGQYPELSLAVIRRVPAAAGTNGVDAVSAATLVTAAGPWGHEPVPVSVPPWLVASRRFTGLVAYKAAGAPVADRLAIRSAMFTPDGQHLVLADLPIGPDLVARIDTTTRTRMGDVKVDQECGGGVIGQTTRARFFDLFRQTVSALECRDWGSAAHGSAWVTIHAPFGRIYDELAEVNRFETGFSSDVFLFALVMLAGLFLIVQGSALVFGALLGKSITSAVHELFVGTERVQQGDFTHRIPIASRDQLGELGESFNRMSASIEHLLHVQREKQRLDDELRIAREIQKSLLPVELPRVDGLDLAEVCEPAREVGGDYFDFFVLGPRRLGVLIADVSGKGTSAALYMAELKGLMLALSHGEPSPRQLLVEVNRRLVNHLDNRSFITMTYAVVDLEAGTLTCARAGHTPLIVVTGDGTDVVLPAGMIIGVRLPGATERFETLLTEHIRPIRPGDAIVLYTDGITEAMDGQGELFGDTALARVVAAHRDLDAAGIRERVLREVRAFVGNAEPHDDMTMVVLKVTGGAAAPVEVAR